MASVVTVPLQKCPEMLTWARDASLDAQGTGALSGCPRDCCWQSDGSTGSLKVEPKQDTRPEIRPRTDSLWRSGAVHLKSTVPQPWPVTGTG